MADSSTKERRPREAVNGCERGLFSQSAKA